MSYNDGIYMEQGAKKMVVTSSGELEIESGGLLDIQAGAKFTVPVESLSTATTGSAMAANGMSVISATKTAKTFTLGTPVAGMKKKIVCTNATATGKISVNMGSSDRTFDGTNWVYDFLKGSDAIPTIVHLICLTTGRWIETYRSVADGTTLAST